MAEGDDAQQSSLLRPRRFGPMGLPSSCISLFEVFRGVVMAGRAMALQISESLGVLTASPQLDLDLYLKCRG
jgi:hypothetical protein